MEKYYVGDVGTEITLDCGVSLSSVTTKQIKYIKPDGSSGFWEATVVEVTKLQYSTAAGDWDQAGIWILQPYVISSAWTGHGESISIEVLAVGTGLDFTNVSGSVISKVRALINDTDKDDFVMTDSKLSIYYDLAQNIYTAAALALNAIAASRSLLAKKRSAGDYSEDLTYIAKECRETAKLYNELAGDESAAELLVPADAQAEVIYDDFSAREIEVNKSLRGDYE